jgi:transcriptional regulator with XRE-family HTH domain
MTDHRIYHFDTLPVRPRPGPLESFTSYLTRLAEVNGIQTLGRLSTLCFPEGRGKFSPPTGDYPPVSFGLLPTAAWCPEERLRAMTLYHLGNKFGRLTRPQPLSQFLSGSVTRHLRYCPNCLAERGYYALTWRFLEIKGCSEHGCQLLECCGHCGQVIPLLARTLKRLGVCPACGGDLRDCRSERLDEAARQAVQARERDFVFLLTPQPCEATDRRLNEVVGERFATWRQYRHLKVADVADYIGQATATIYFIEQGPVHRGVKFCWYVQYADFLQVGLQDIFESPSPRLDDVPTREDKLIADIQEAITVLERQGQPVTQETVGRMVGVCVRMFAQSPRIRALWAAERDRRRRQLEAELVRQVHRAVEKLEQAGEPLSQEALARQIGRNPEGLKEYPQVRALLGQVAEKERVGKARRTQQREEQLLENVRLALVSLEAAGQKVSKQAIADIVGTTVSRLNRYPGVRKFLLEQVIERHQEHWARWRQRREQELIRRTQQAIEALTSAGKPVTQRAVCRKMNLGRPTVGRYPGVLSLLRQATSVKPDSRSEGSSE